MEGKSPRKFSEDFKFNVVLESFITGDLAATAARHNVHVTLVNNWRKQLKNEGPKLFAFRKGKSNQEQRMIDQLEKIIGRLTIENQILKKTQEMIR
ncbi:transposase [Candidatus Gottesmanbacteria bacterium]|nr:transposase [Candidatus Gottesmanbacteria bacterium]